MTASPHTVAIVEDEAALRNSLAEMLADSAEWQVVATYSNAELALASLTVQPPDVVLMDIQLPGMTGSECAAALKAAHPEVQILMITVYDDSERVFNALSSGASGYLLKRDVPTRLKQALHDVLTGGSPVSSTVARKLFQHFSKEVPALPGEGFNLTPRERETLDLLAKGQIYKEIADVMGIGLETVHFHVHNIYKKLHVRSRTEAVLKYLGK